MKVTAPLTAMKRGESYYRLLIESGLTFEQSSDDIHSNVVCQILF